MQSHDNQSHDNAPHNESPRADDWGACPRGAIGELVAGLRRGRRWLVMYQVGGAAAAVVLAFGISIWLAADALREDAAPAPQDGPLGGIVCDDVREHLPAYISGALRDKQIIAHIEQHLSNCAQCLDRYHELGGEKTFAVNGQVSAAFVRAIAWRRRSGEKLNSAFTDGCCGSRHFH